MGHSDIVKIPFLVTKIIYWDVPGTWPVFTGTNRHRSQGQVI